MIVCVTVMLVPKDDVITRSCYVQSCTYMYMYVHVHVCIILYACIMYVRRTYGNVLFLNDQAEQTATCFEHMATKIVNWRRK